MSEQNHAPAVSPAPEVAAPRFVSDRPRLKTVPLEWPVEYDGKLYTEITVHRMTTSEVAAFIRDVEANASTATLPMFDAPKQVIDALDDDDATLINEAVTDFLPRRLRDAVEAP